MIDQFEFLIIFLSIVIIRLIMIKKIEPYKSYFSTMPQGDAAIYFMLIQFWRDNSKGNFDQRCLISNEGIYYPNFYEIVFGKIFSDSTLFKHSYLPNFIIYSISLLSYMIFLQEQYINLYYFIYGLLLFCMWVDIVGMDRLRIHYLSLQPRYLGAILCSWYFYLYVCSSPTSIYCLFCQIALITIGLNVSIFTRQALIFITILFSIYSLSIMPITNLLIGFFINLLVQRKKFVADIICECKYHKWYFNNFPKPMLKDRLIRDTLAKLFSGNIKQTSIYLIYFILVYLYIYNSRDSFQNEIINVKNLIYLLFSIITVVVITSLRKFAFVGESFRYISFSLMIIAPYFILLATKNINNVYVDFFVLLLMVGNIYVASIISGKPNIKEVCNIQKFFNNFEKHDGMENAVWYGIPYYSTTLPLLLGFGQKSLLFQIGNHSEEMMKKYFKVYPFLNFSTTLLNEHEITHIIIDKAYTKEFRIYYKYQIFSEMPWAEDENYAIYKV